MKPAFAFAAGLSIIVIAMGAMAIVFWHPGTSRVACTMEAKLCPDGSAVGRTGPNCEFAACPSAGESQNFGNIGQTISISGVSITPIQVVQDSRCALDVQCIWAGTVQLRVKLEREGGTQEAVLTLGTPITFAGKRVELTKVDPAPRSKQTILPAGYIFYFSVTEAR